MQKHLTHFCRIWDNSYSLCPFCQVTLRLQMCLNPSFTLHLANAKQQQMLMLFADLLCLGLAISKLAIS